MKKKILLWIIAMVLIAAIILAAQSFNLVDFLIKLHGK
jgi:hypothetical protein